MPCLMLAKTTKFPERNLFYTTPAKKHAQHCCGICSAFNIQGLYYSEVQKDDQVHTHTGMTESRHFKALSSTFGSKIQDSRFAGLLFVISALGAPYWIQHSRSRVWESSILHLACEYIYIYMYISKSALKSFKAFLAE